MASGHGQRGRFGVGWVRLLGAVLCLWACAPPFPRDALVIGRVTIPSCALLYVAEDHGLFARNRLEVRFRDFSTGREALEAVIQGEVDLATVYETPLVLRVMEGNPVAAITTLHRGTRLSGVVARAGRGISTAADLAGRRVGVTPRTNADFLLDLMLAESGLTLGQVQVSFAPQPELVKAFQEGTLDAVTLWTPYLQLARLGLEEPVVELTTEVYLEVSTLTGRKDVLAMRAPALERLVRSLYQAEELINAGREEPMAALSKRFPQLPVEELRRIRDRSRYEVGLSNLLLTVLRQQAAWLERERQVVHRDMDWRSALAVEPLKQVVPDAITLLSTARGDVE